MRKDTSLSDRKLTRKEFAAKYWKGGDPSFIYQYHTLTIEDGRDEREQLLINNIRALWSALKDLRRRGLGLELAEQADATLDCADHTALHVGDTVTGE